MTRSSSHTQALSVKQTVVTFSILLTRFLSRKLDFLKAHLLVSGDLYGDNDHTEDPTEKTHSLRSVRSSRQNLQHLMSDVVYIVSLAYYLAFRIFHHFYNMIL